MTIREPGGGRAAADTVDRAMPTVAIIPVKHFQNAKQRLAAALPGGARRALAEAMFTDVLTAVRRAPSVDAVLVVGGDPDVQRLAEGYGARAVEDPAESGQDQAVVRAVAVARELGATRVLCLPGDCPLVDPAELEQLLALPCAQERCVTVIADRHGTGTNGLLLSPPDAFEPRYGPDSFARHLRLAREAGCAVATLELPSLALDVDTPEDLAALEQRLAQRRGGAAHTRGMLSRIERSIARGPR